MSQPGRCELQEVHHAHSIQKAIARDLRVQINQIRLFAFPCPRKGMGFTISGEVHIQTLSDNPNGMAPIKRRVG